MNRVIKLISQNTIMQIALIFLSLSLIVFVYSAHRLSEVVPGIQEKRATLHNQQNIQLNFEEVLEAYNRQYDDLSVKLVQFRPDLDEIVSLLNSLESKAGGIGLSLDIESLSKSEEMDNIRYNVSFVANYNQFHQFQDILAKLPSLIQVEGIYISAEQDFKLKELANYSIIFDVFIQ